MASWKWSECEQNGWKGRSRLLRGNHGCFCWMGNSSDKHYLQIGNEMKTYFRSREVIMLIKLLVCLMRNSPLSSDNFFEIFFLDCRNTCGPAEAHSLSPPRPWKRWEELNRDECSLRCAGCSCWNCGSDRCNVQAFPSMSLTASPSSSTSWLELRTHTGNMVSLLLRGSRTNCPLETQLPTCALHKRLRLKINLLFDITFA